MKKIGLLTCQRLPYLSEADQQLIPLFAAKGYTAEALIWNDDSIIWKDYFCLIIRNTWDYYKESTAFSQWLDTIKNAGVPMFNSVEVVKQNMHKFYLKGLEEKGIRIIPTLFSAKTKPVKLDEIHWQKMVIKPAISAGSYQTEVFELKNLSENSLHAILQKNDYLIQPYLSEITVNGEISLIYFNGKFSHSVIKKPTDGDFRVQKQFGGLYRNYQPEAELIEVGKNIITQIPSQLLYARVDGILLNNVFHLMELELIEPDLYFEFAKGIAESFVENAVQRL